MAWYHVYISYLYFISTTIKNDIHYQMVLYINYMVKGKKAQYDKTPLVGTVFYAKNYIMMHF